ncbi:YfjI family protein [Desulfosporosinus sp. SB140]|uniref:YfjI family protein n=1 Tax=Desulfosporosinus paludis TaxID=3115649 RepID=UPI00388DDF17
MATLAEKLAEAQKIAAENKDLQAQEHAKKILEWPEPEELREESLRPVQSIIPTMIPEVFRPWLTDISNRMQCPLEFVAAASIVVSSALIGAGCGIRPKQRDDWTVIPNLWGGIIARPSMLKTPSLAEVMKPLGRLEAEAKEQFEENLLYYEADLEIHKAQREALKSEMQAVAKGKKNAPTKSMDVLKGELIELEIPETPVRKRYRTNDSTIEKLGELLNENPRGLLVFRDELIGLLCSWDREDRAQDRAFYLEAWNGNGSFTTDRIGRGTLDVKNCCVSLLGGIQPAKLTGYLQQAISDVANDGLLQRFQLLVYPDEPKKWELIDEWPDKNAKDIAWKAIKELAAMDFLAAGAELMDEEKIPFFRFSSGGQAIFNDWITELEYELRSEEMPLMVEHLAKYRSLMPSLSLIFHLLDITTGKPGGPITEQAALMAAAWTEFLEQHARRIYAIVEDVSIRATANLANKIRTRKVSDGFTVRDVYPKGWTLLDTKEKVEAACRELVEANWLRPDQVEIPGRQAKKVYRVNPKIFSSNE